MIQLISQNWVDWESFISKSNDLLKRKLTNKIDESRKEYTNLDGYIAALDSFSNFKNDPKQALANISLLGLVSLTFLTDNNEAKHLTPLIKVLTSSTNNIFICCGNLNEWRDIIIFLSRRNQTPQLLTDLVLEFERLKLSGLWRKRNTSTGFTLEYL